MNKLSFLLIAVLSFFALTAPVFSATSQYGDIKISMQAPMECQSSHGYVEYPFILTNTSNSNHQVTLDIPLNKRGGYGSRITSLSKTVAIPAGATVKVCLYQPCINLYGSGVNVKIDGKRYDSLSSLSSSFPSSVSYYGYDRTEILVTKSAMTRRMPGENKEEKIYDILANIPPEAWSDNWLAYTRYDIIAITDEDAAAMSPETRNALLRYAECGGILLVSGKFDLPESWLRLRKNRKNSEVYYTGLGLVVIMPGDFDAAGKEIWRDIFVRERENKSILAKPVEENVTWANRNLPVIEKVSLSAAGIMIIMFVFTIVIGPVNLLVVTRKKKKIWLLWTVPAGSVLFILILLVFALLSENWGGQSCRRTLTILDETTHRATSFGRLAYYYPMPPWDGLKFSPESEISAYGIRESRQLYTLNWTNGQHLYSGWLRAKVPCQLMLRKSEPRRERLETIRENGKLFVVNGLGVEINELKVFDFDYRIYTGFNVKAGEKKELKPEGKLNVVYFDTLTLNYSFNSSRFNVFSSNLAVPGIYMAKLEKNPFVEAGVELPAKHKEEAYLVGIMRKEAAK